MVTLKEIAKAVGLSPATVSRVLNFDQTLSVAAKTRQAIIEAAEAMKYENPRARSRANQQGLSKVALVHSLRPDQELVDPYYVGLRLGIESRCQALKIETVKVYHTDRTAGARPCSRAPPGSSPSAGTMRMRSPGSNCTTAILSLPISARRPMNSIPSNRT